MGLVKRDMITPTLRNDAQYEYTATGITRLLGDLYRLRQEAFGGVASMADAVAMLADLDVAVAAPNVLTSRQKQVVALYYANDLTQSEIAMLLGTAPSSVRRSLESAHERLSLHLTGEPPKYAGRIFDVIDGSRDLDLPASLREFIAGVGRGDIAPLTLMRGQALADLQTLLAAFDANMADGLRERANPTHQHEYESTSANATEDYRAALKAEYPYYSSKVGVDKRGRIVYTLSPESVMTLKQKRVKFTAEADDKPQRTRRDQRRRAEVRGASDGDDNVFRDTPQVYVRMPHDGDIRKFGRGRNAFWTHQNGWNWGKRTKKVAT